MKKRVIILILVVLLAVGCEKKEEKEEKKVVEPFLLMELDNYKNIKLEDISSIEVVKYTVAGDNRITYDDYNDINEIFTMLKSVKLKDKTDMVCEDNTTVYVIRTKDDEKYSIEFECNWVIIGKDRYLVFK